MLPYAKDFRVTKLYGTPAPVGVTYSAGKHAGMDFVGTDKNILSIGAGVVHKTGYDKTGWGNYVVIRNVDGNYVIYAHLQKYSVKAGQVIREGEVIGVEGATGQVTGVHLHLEIRKIYTNKYSTIDPADYLKIPKKIATIKVVDDEMIVTTKLNLNGVVKTVNCIQKNGNNYIKLQDLRDGRISVAYENGMPKITVVK